MSTVEDLFVEIFDRKHKIIELVKQHTDRYSQHLATKCKIQGINPPLWLFDVQQLSNLKELNKEQLISECFPRPPTVRYDSARCSLNKRPVVRDDDEDMSHGTFLEVHVSNQGLHPEDGAANAAVDPDNNQECALNTVPEPDVSVNSPLDQTDARVLNSFNDLDLSLARIQRSKSRQKALQLRNSAQAEAESCSSWQKKCDVAPIGIGLSTSEQVDHNYESEKWSEPRVVSNSSGGFKESAERNCEEDREINLHTGENSKHKASTETLECVNHNEKVDRLSNVAERSHTTEVDKSFAIAQKSHSTRKNSCNFAATGTSLSASPLIDFSDKPDHLSESFPVGTEVSKLREFVEVHQHEGTEVNRVTRSRSNCKQLNCINDSLKVDGPADAVQKDDHTQAHSAGCVSGRSLEVANTSSFHKPIVKSYQETKKKNGSYCGRITRSRSMAPKLPCLGDDSHAAISTVSDRMGSGVFAPAIGGSSEVLFNNLDPLTSVKPSTVLDHKSPKPQSNMGGQVIAEPVDTSTVAGSGGAGFMSADSEKSSHENCDTHYPIGSKSIIPSSDNNDTHNQQGNTEVVMEGSPPCRSRTGNSKPKVGVEHLVASPPHDCFMPMKPKQLDFDDTEECNLQRTLSPNFEEKSMKSTDKISNTTLEPTSEKKISGSPVDSRFSREQSILEREISSKRNEVPGSSSTMENREPSVTVMNGRASDMNEHHASRNTKYETSGRQCPRQSSYLHDDETLSNDVGHHDADANGELSLKESYNSMVELHVEVGGKSCDRNTQCLPASYAVNNETAATLHFSTLTGDSQDYLVKELELDDPTSSYSDAKKQLSMPNDPNLSCLDGENSHGDACGKHYMDRDSHQKENDMLTWPQQSGCNHEENLDLWVSSEIENARESSLFDGRFRSVQLESWPQFKRKRLEDKQSNCFSVCPSSQMAKLCQAQMDAVSLNVSGSQEKTASVMEHIPSRAKSSNMGVSEKISCPLKEGIGSLRKLQTETDAICFEKQNNRTESASSADDKLLRVSHVSSLFQQPAEKELETAEEHELLSDAEKFSDEQDSPDLLHLEKNVELDHPENRTCLERQSHIGKQSLCSQSFVFSSPQSRGSDILDADQSKPMLEGFIIDTSATDGELDIAQLGINYETTIQRASILEQICKSSSAHTPLSHFTSSFGFDRAQNLYQSLPNGILEHLDLSTFLSEDDVNRQIRASYSCVDELKDSKLEIPCSDYQPSCGCQFGARSGKQYQSPVGKFWERIPSHSSSSEKGLNLNPELMCFPIEEDPNSSEENETADVAGKISDELYSTVVNSHVKRLPLASITNSCLNAPASVSAAERSHARGSLDSVNTDVSCTEHHNKAKRKLGSSLKNMSAAKVKQTPLTSAKGIKQGKESLRRSSRPKLSAKSSFKRERQKLSEKGPSRNNIVSNVTSFVPLVQQKQAAAVCTVKRDVKVKALEAAEAAKRLEEKKENERKMRKEAMKHERARLEQENSKQLELHKKRKEEEKKKKEADAIARKRLREVEEKNERERKRKRVEEARRQQREQDDKTHAKRAEKDKGLPTNDERTMAKKKCSTEVDMCQKEKERVGKNSKKQESETKTTETLRNDSFQATPSTGRCHISDKSIDHEKGDIECGTKKSLEKSYEISPYQCSDDEEDEDEDAPIRKFIPSWASKPNVASALPMQQGIDPDSIFPPESFCSMDEVLVPRKVQQRPTPI